MRKLRIFGILMTLAFGCVAEIAAEGMIDTLGDFETEAEELILQSGTLVIFNEDGTLKAEN